MRVCRSRLVPRCINLDGVSGRRRENDVENTGIDHSDDGKVKTDRSFAIFRHAFNIQITSPIRSLTDR